MLFVTHDQEEALTLGDRIAVMHLGRLEQLGTPLEIYRKPATRFVASFIGDMNFLLAECMHASACGTKSTARLAIGGPDQEISGRHPAGRRVVACVRPERVVLRPASGGGARTGVVKYAGFSGDSIRYAVALPTGAELLVREPALESKAGFSVGDAVALEWADPVLNAFPE